MRLIMVRLIAMLALAFPITATAQTDVRPTIVQNLRTAEVPSSVNPMLATVAGATVVIVGINAWTGGALLAPSIGPGISAALGGSWLGAGALTPPAAQWMFETTALVASGFVGGGIGYWLAR